MKVAEQVVAFVVIAGARGKSKAVAHAQFSQEIPLVTELAPVHQRTNRAIAGEGPLAFRILEIVSIGFKRVCIVDPEYPGDAGGVFAIGREKESLKRCDGSKTAVKFPGPLAKMEAAH